MADKKSRGLSIEVDVDVSEALTGLKALQREAKKATQALRELETQQERVIPGETFFDELEITLDGFIGRENTAEARLELRKAILSVLGGGLA